MDAFKPTPALLAFLDEYTVDFNGKHAAMRCGAKEQSAAASANAFLNRPGVSAELQRRIAARGDAAAISQADIVRELRDLVMFDPRRFYDAKGNLKKMHELDEFEARASVHFDIYAAGEGGPIRAKSTGKLKSMELLGKHLGMWLDDRIKDEPIKVTVDINYGEPPKKKNAASGS